MVCGWDGLNAVLIDNLAYERKRRPTTYRHTPRHPLQLAPTHTHTHRRRLAHSDTVWCRLLVRGLDRAGPVAVRSGLGGSSSHTNQVHATITAPPTKRVALGCAGKRR